MRPHASKARSRRQKGDTVSKRAPNLRQSGNDTCVSKKSQVAPRSNKKALSRMERNDASQLPSTSGARAGNRRLVRGSHLSRRTSRLKRAHAHQQDQDAELQEALQQSYTTEVKSHGVTKHMRMREWLEHHLNSTDVPGLAWLDRPKVFTVEWIHKSRRTFNAATHSDIFCRWALHKGQPTNDHTAMKATFRCALSSLKDVKQVTKEGAKRGANAKRTYRFLSPSDPEYGRRRRKAVTSKDNVSKNAASQASRSNRYRDQRQRNDSGTSSSTSPPHSPSTSEQSLAESSLSNIEEDINELLSRSTLEQEAENAGIPLPVYEYEATQASPSFGKSTPPSARIVFPVYESEASPSFNESTSSSAIIALPVYENEAIPLFNESTSSLPLLSEEQSMSWSSSLWTSPDLVPIISNQDGTSSSSTMCDATSSTYSFPLPQANWDDALDFIPVAESVNIPSSVTSTQASQWQHADYLNTQTASNIPKNIISPSVSEIHTASKLPTNVISGNFGQTQTACNLPTNIASLSTSESRTASTIPTNITISSKLIGSQPSRDIRSQQQSPELEYMPSNDTQSPTLTKPQPISQKLYLEPLRAKLARSKQSSPALSQPTTSNSLIDLPPMPTFSPNTTTTAIKSEPSLPEVVNIKPEVQPEVKFGTPRKRSYNRGADRKSRTKHSVQRSHQSGAEVKCRIPNFAELGVSDTYSIKEIQPNSRLTCGGNVRVQNSDSDADSRYSIPIPEFILSLPLTSAPSIPHQDVTNSTLNSISSPPIPTSSANDSSMELNYQSELHLGQVLEVYDDESSSLFAETPRVPSIYEALSNATAVLNDERSADIIVGDTPTIDSTPQASYSDGSAQTATQTPSLQQMYEYLQEVSGSALKLPVSNTKVISRGEEFNNSQNFPVSSGGTQLHLMKQNTSNSNSNMLSQCQGSSSQNTQLGNSPTFQQQRSILCQTHDPTLQPNNKKNTQSPIAQQNSSRTSGTSQLEHSRLVHTETSSSQQTASSNMQSNSCSLVSTNDAQPGQAVWVEPVNQDDPPIDLAGLQEPEIDLFCLGAM